MGFFSKLKKVVAGVDKGAVLAQAALPGKAGKVAGGVAEGTGVVTTIVQQLQSQGQTSSPPAAAPADPNQQAVLATAVAVDDHEERIKELEQLLARLKAGGSGQQPTGGQTGGGQSPSGGGTSSSGGGGQQPSHS